VVSIFSTGLQISGVVVINASRQFVGAGVNCTADGVAASGFNPYSGGQYFGVSKNNAGTQLQVLCNDGAYRSLVGGVIVETLGGDH
jgi:hypothetical protein